MSNPRRSRTERQFLVMEAIIALALAVLFLIVALDDETTPGLVGIALSLLLLGLLAWRAARTGD